MGTVTRLATSAEEVTLGEAWRQFDQVQLKQAASAHTRRAYSYIGTGLIARFGEDVTPGDLSPAALGEWFTGQWGDSKASTWSARRGALRSFLGYCAERGWVADAPGMMRAIPGKTIKENRDRALTRDEITALLTDSRIPLRERTLWRMLYETAARSAEVLRLDVPDLDMPNRRSRVQRKGGAMDVIVWQTETARLLPRLLKGRKRGPVFLTYKRSRMEAAPADRDPESGLARLSYEQAEQLFKKHSGGKTLHQLRHSALTHAAEDGTSTPMMMARSGHASVRSLAKYARPSAEALQRHMAETDPARRR